MVVLLVSLYSWDVYRLFEFKKRAHTYFNMGRTWTMLVMNIVQIVDGLVVWWLYLVRYYEAASVFLFVFFMLVAIRFVLVIVFQETLHKDIDKKIWSRCVIKRNALIDAMDQRSDTIGEDIFKDKYSYKTTWEDLRAMFFPRYSDYVTIDSFKRKEWANYLRLLDDNSVYQLKYSIAKRSGVDVHSNQIINTTSIVKSSATLRIYS